MEYNKKAVNVNIILQKNYKIILTLTDNNKEESKQLEDLIKYELIGTKNENMIQEFIEKIKNEK